MNNYIFDNYNMYRNMRNDNYFPYMNNNMNNINNINLFNPTEGFEKGNMFEDWYQQYKNYKPARLMPKSEKEKRMQEIQTYCFALHDLNLYLDIHPENQSLLTLFNDYNNKVIGLIKEYENIFGPITTSGINTTKGFNWLDTFPWESEANNTNYRGEVDYV